VPESFTCDDCGKTFPTEGDMMQHTQAMHGNATVGSYKQTDQPKKDDDAGVPPMTPRNG